jgi:hypothetical protein
MLLFSRNLTFGKEALLSIACRIATPVALMRIFFHGSMTNAPGVISKAGMSQEGHTCGGAISQNAADAINILP